jgi:hypothetical protein
MSTPSYQELLSSLEASGHLSGKARAEAEQAVAASTQDGDSNSRLISVFAGIGAWLATIFLVASLFAFDVVDSGDLSGLVVSVILGAVAVALHRRQRQRNVFTAQMTLATSSAAQAIALSAMSDLAPPMQIVGTIVVCCAMYVLVSSTPNRVFSAALLAGRLGFDAAEADVGFLLLFASALALPCVVFGARRALPSRLRLALRPAAYVGATVALLFSAEVLAGEVANWLPMAQRVMLAVAAVALLAVAHMRTTRDDDDHRFVWAAAAVGILGLLTSPGILCAALIVGVGLWRHRSSLVGLGAVGLAFHLFAYYYQLEITLLEKSGLLVASGSVLLGLRWVLNRYADANLDQSRPDQSSPNQSSPAEEER